MKTTQVPWALHEGPVSHVLAKIYLDSSQDQTIIENALAETARWKAPPTLQQMTDMARHAGLPVSREVGALLYMLVRASRPRCVVEFGSSFGASLVYLAAAVRDIGGGQVLGTELNAEKVEIASRHVAEADLEPFVELRAGNALETLRGDPKCVDFLLLDGWKDLYLPVLNLLEDRLSPEAVIVSDNLSMLPREYLEKIRDPERFDSLSLPLGDGVEISTVACRSRRRIEEKEPEDV